MAWHSTHTAGLLKEFQSKVFGQIAQPIGLILFYRAEGQETDALACICHDLAVLCCVLLDQWDEKELNAERAAFLFEMVEFCLKPMEFNGNSKPPCSLTIPEHIARYRSQNANLEWPGGRHSPTHIHALTLECLREYDEIKKTKHATTWKNFLYKVIDKAFSLNPKTTEKDTLLKARLRESYEQAFTGGRSAGFKHHMGKDMATGLKTLVMQIGGAWRMFQNTKGNEKFLAHDFMSQAKTDLLSLACSVLKTEQPLTQKSLELLSDFAPSIGIYGIDADQFRSVVTDFEDMPEIFRELPNSLKMMDLLQETYKDQGSDFAETGRAMFYSFVKCMVQADKDEPSKEELKLLIAFATTLFGPGAADKLGLNEMAGVPAITHTVTIRESSSSDDPMTDLAALVGLERVKSDVQQLINFTKVQEMRSSKGLSTATPTRHMVFYGNPGTGKTTVARLIAQLYKGLGVLSKGHLVECDRSGLVGGYLGQTAIKVNEVVKEALGGVLFIDEAYSLVQGGNDTYGPEAIDTLLKLMEDNRHDLAVIVAGYPEKMAHFINSNPGLRSRFTKVFLFDDYTPAQLLEIFNVQAKEAGYEVADNASAFLAKLFDQMYRVRDASFGNGRDVRNVFEAAMANQANRLAVLPESDLTEEALLQITIDDVKGMIDPERFKSSKPQSIGFRTLAEERA